MMATFNIYSVSKNGAVPVVGVVVGAFGVHHDVLVNFNGKHKYGPLWNVTHIPTGHKIVSFYRRADALRLARSLTSPSWNSPHWRFGEQPKVAGKEPNYFMLVKAEVLAALKAYLKSDFAP